MPPPAAVAPKPAAVGLTLAYGDSDEEDESDEEPQAAAAVKGKQAPAEPAQKSNTAVALPDGFFDDKAKDAKAHNRVLPKKLTMDEEMELFEDEIEEDMEVLDKQEDEEVKKQVARREKEEKEDQDLMEARVNGLQEARKKLVGRRADEAQTGGGRKRGRFLQVSDGEESDESDGEDMLDWRRKAV